MKPLIPRLYLLLLLAVAGGAPAFDFPESSPAAQGLDPALLASLTPRLASGELGSIDGVMILRNGEVIYREHFRGYQGQPLPVFSVTKSVGSILIGTMVRDGLIDTGDFLNDRFPEYPQLRLNATRSQITVEHVLQMRHGYDWVELPYGRSGHPIEVMLSSPDWIRTILTWPLEGPPGESFNYSTGVSGIMSGLVRNATGLTVQNYARRELFDPLGIEGEAWDITCHNTRQVCIPEAAFPDGNATLGFGLWLKLEDLARIGQMMLNGGEFDGQRIISPEWIAVSRATWSDSESDPESFTVPGSGYGYQWWILPITDSRGRTWDMYYASGYGRQYIMMFPEADLVVVELSGDYEYDGPGLGVGLREHILPAILDEETLAPLTARLNGSWYDPDAPGQGLNVEVLEDRGEVLAYWYTYDEAGNQRWMIGQGPIEDDIAHLDFLVSSGGRFADPQVPTLTAWGTGELSFAACLEGALVYASVDGDLSGTVPLARLTGSEQCQVARGKGQLP